MFRMVAACPQCRGRGKLITKKCTDCRGSGRKPVAKQVESKFRPGFVRGKWSGLPKRASRQLRSFAQRQRTSRRLACGHS